MSEQETRDFIKEAEDAALANRLLERTGRPLREHCLQMAHQGLMCRSGVGFTTADVIAAAKECEAYIRGEKVEEEDSSMMGSTAQEIEDPVLANLLREQKIAEAALLDLLLERTGRPLREFCLQLAHQLMCQSGVGFTTADVIAAAKAFEAYIKGEGETRREGVAARLRPGLLARG